MTENFDLRELTIVQDVVQRTLERALEFLPRRSLQRALLNSEARDEPTLFDLLRQAYTNARRAATPAALLDFFVRMMLHALPNTSG
ncbi:MAG: hypothetical protein ACREMP_06225 [Candidatus Tyrphobacter sp.]